MKGLLWWVEQVTVQVIDHLLSPPPSLGIDEEER